MAQVVVGGAFVCWRLVGGEHLCNLETAPPVLYNTLFYILQVLAVHDTESEIDKLLCGGD